MGGMKMLSQPQRKVLNAVINYINEHGYPPSIREICLETGHRSSGTVHGLLSKLKQKGFVTWKNGNPRTLKVLKQEKEIENL